jgi:DNA polymerase-3 subunit beta
MTYTFQIDLNVLKAVSTAMSNEETRYYLNGIHFTATKAGKLAIEATDGHRAMRAYIGHEVPEGFAAIVPDSLVKALVKLPKKVEAVIIEIDVEAQKAKAFASNGTIEQSLVGGTFPETSRIFPSKTNGKAARFNGKYVADIDKAGKLLNADPIFHFNGEAVNAVRFQGRRDIICAIMPINNHQKNVDPAGLAQTIDVCF